MAMNKINAESMQKAYDENYQTFLKKNTDYVCFEKMEQMTIYDFLEEL